MSTETTVTNSEQPAEVTPPVAEQPRMIRLKRGRHPEVTRGAFGGKRKDNGINYRTSSLIRAFR
jgi:hypothetical protein